jgi:pentatricopeptide repeat protein
MKDTEFYTATMAEVYARQGHFEKAVEIYRYLLEREPNRKDIIEALAEIEEKIGTKGAKKDRDLVPLFRKWLQLILEYNRLQKLKKFQHDLSSK